MPTGTQRYLLIVGLGCALGPALALSELPHDRIPSGEPGIDIGTTASVSEKVDVATLTSAIPLLPSPELSDAPGEMTDISVLKAGLDALAGSDVDEARKFRDGLPADALDRHILTWAIAMSGDPEVSSGEIAAAAKILSKWPGTEALRNNRERALYRENRDPQTVIDSFDGSEPQTVQGVSALARAYLALGRPDAARAVLSPFWRTQKLEARDEAAIIKRFGKVLSSADHRFRMERMLYAERPNSAQRVAGLAGAKQLADAWSAVLARRQERPQAARCRACRAALGRLSVCRGEVSAPHREEILGGSRRHDEGAERQGFPRRSRRVVDGKAGPVARTGRPRRHQERLQAGRRTFGRADQQRRRRRIPCRLVRAARA